MYVTQMYVTQMYGTQMYGIQCTTVAHVITRIYLSTLYCIERDMCFKSKSHGKAVMNNV